MITINTLPPVLLYNQVLKMAKYDRLQKVLVHGNGSLGGSLDKEQRQVPERSNRA